MVTVRPGCTRAAFFGPAVARRALAGVLLVAVAVGCSDASSGRSTAPSAADDSPAGTVLVPVGTWTWRSPDGLRAARDAAAALPAARPLTILLPEGSPVGGRVTSGRLQVSTATGDRLPRSNVTVDVAVGEAGRTVGLVATPSSVAPSCADRLAEDWVERTVRGLEGCQLVNEAALTFVEWQEDDTALHVESDLDADVLVAWLAAWTPVR